MRLHLIVVLLQFRVEILYVRHILRHVLRRYDQQLQSWSPPSTSPIMNCKGTYKLTTFSLRPSQILVLDKAPGKWAALNDFRIQSNVWCRRWLLPLAECCLRSEPEKYTFSLAIYPKGRHASADRRDYKPTKSV
jgi:hypothetical protein